MKPLSMLFAASVLWLGCSGARSPEQYRDDTQKLLDGRSSAIKTCYDGVLKADPQASGRVSVKFAIEKGTGKLVDAKVEPTTTTAPASVGQCVLSSLDGVVIQPGDKHRGEATWSWDFSAAQAAR